MPQAKIIYKAYFSIKQDYAIFDRKLLIAITVKEDKRFEDFRI